jgi:integrase
MELIKEKLSQERPNITKSSVNTYASLLKSLYLKAHPNLDNIDLDWFKNEEAVLKHLEDKPANCRKTVLASVIVLNGKDFNNSKLVSKMNEDSSEYQKFIQTQKMTEKQKENWMDYAEIKKIEKALYEEVKSDLNSKKPLDDYHRNKLNRWMACAISGGVYFPPRRSEWIHVKLEDVDEKTDNYIDMKNSEFIFNQYKTAKTYGKEAVKFPPEFGVLLKKYLNKVKGQKYFIEYAKNHSPKPLTASAYTLLLNDIYNKKISVSMLRHIYLSNLYKNVPALKKMEETAADMGHTLIQGLQYVKSQS